MKLSDVQKREFLDGLWHFYSRHKRSFAWRMLDERGSIDPYKIVVSEIMLQQTQASRVVPYFERFIYEFPNFSVLAGAELATVLKSWQGLGYNRRARYLHLIAQKVTSEFSGILPVNLEQLTALPGIGSNTAGAIVVYTFNRPALFVETNIRTVITYHFFKNEPEVSDVQVRQVLGQLLERKNAREFYWAMMDYGSDLKKQGIRLNARNKQYRKQTAFQGSFRQLRGEVLRHLTVKTRLISELEQLTNDERLGRAIASLEKDKLIEVANGHVFLAK